MNVLITSKSNPIVKETAALKEKKGRARANAFLVEGEKMTAECIGAGLEIDRVFLAEDCENTVVSRIRSALSARGVAEDKIVYLSRGAFAALSDEKTPQGVACVAKLPNYAPQAPAGDCLLLDGISDPGNLGTIIRTANAAGYRELYLVSCADAFSPKCVRASMSGIFFVKTYDVGREEALRLLQGTQILAADMGGENVFSCAAPEKIALAIGNEAHGLSAEVRAAAARTVAVPMDAKQESLNAAVAAAVAMYALRRDRFLR